MTSLPRLCLLIALAAPPALAAPAAAAPLQGTVKGDADATFTIDAHAGQTLALELVSKNRSLNMNISAPGAQEAMFIGSVQGPKARVLLPADGAYRVKVYLVRSAARRNERADFTLQVALAGQPLAPLPGAQDARVAGSSFHAVAALPCRLPGLAAVATCQASVVRRGRDGTATVVLQHEGQQVRTLLFQQGRPVASDSAQPLSATRQGDLSTVRIGSDEQVELPDALLTGG